MPDDLQGPRKRRTKLWLALAALLLLLALIFIPPYISLNHYKARVTQSVAAALGRPVRLSDVELRLLPRPGFLLTDLTVQEEPAYGVEPVLHAGEVKAAIRFSSLWQGKLQISRISVDDASLNLVHMPNGEWNFDSLFRNAAAGSKNGANRQQPPYLEANHARINIKDGIEKLPFSFLDADASLWQESNGNWRVRLKAQPARTDVTLDLADTGIVRMDATLRPGPQLYQMPLHIDLDWREAQLGQLSRLVLSSDQGWRGDLTGELHLDGTAASAKVQARLRAAGVHRAEFAPAAPMDFDATCAFTLQYSRRSVDDLVCNSPLGDGRARITGSVPGGGQKPRVTVELDRIPAQAALDLLRTMRNSIDPSLQAAGSVSGHMTYDPVAAQAAAQAEPAVPSRRVAGRGHAPQPRKPPSPVSGAFTVTGLRISGEALSRPIQVANMSLEPAPDQPGQPAALFTSMSIPAGGPTPLALTARIALRSFELGVHGVAALPRLREFAHVTGSDAEQALAELAGDPAMLDFTAQGPWVPPPDTRLALSPTFGPVPPARSIQTNGTVALKNATWKASFLASPVLLPAATLRMENGKLRWDPVEFSYGPLEGNATLEIPDACPDSPVDPGGCPAKFTLHFGELDSAALQTALLGAPEKGTLLSSLLDRIKPNAPPGWPQLEGTTTADTLLLGPFSLTRLTASVRVLPTGADIPSFDAALMGGTVHGTATLLSGDKPDYKVDASFADVSPAPLGQLAAVKASGGPVRGNGKFELVGFTDADLGKSARGNLHFDWQRGAVAGAGVPTALSRFDHWSGDAALANGEISLDGTTLRQAGKTSTVQGRIVLGTPATLSFGPRRQPETTAKARPAPR
ncbi:MAG TPA: AsmA family protein [Terracidiphilus sp.]